MSARYDVVVVGAGMAGLCAARALAKAGKQLLLLEAGERAGGRVWTAASSGGTIACELGAEFVHGKPEPTLRLAREAGVELLPLGDHHVSKQGTVFRGLQSPWQEFAAVLERVRPQDEDTSARTFLERNVDDPQLCERIRQLVEGFEAAPLSEVGIQSLTTDAQSLSREHSQFRLAGGYGRVVDFCVQELVEAKVELRLGSRVTQVKWQVHGPVELSVAGRADVIGGRACVMTVPLPILQDSESLRFEPGLPGLHAPLARLGMGHAARVMLQFRKDFAARAAPRNVFIHQPSALYEAYWAQENDAFVQWTAWAGGPKAEELARESSEQRKHLALAGLATLLGLPEATLEGALVCPIRHHDFSNDSLLRGAYSFCRPGGAQAAQALSAPVGGALFLAGEATDHDYPGTVAGAIASGIRAAEQALSVLAS